MSKKLDDINDNEIRIISGNGTEQQRRPNRLLRVCLPIAAVLVLLCVFRFVFSSGSDKADEVIQPQLTQEEIPEPTSVVIEEPITDVKGFTVALDTVVAGRGMLILSPENARPRLVVGTEQLNDSSIILATQAADVRADNGKIAGAFVLNGELISKGQAKAGFCSIIHGDLTIGFADATPMLELALTDGGYFFRQYPLVVGGQIVENKPKGNSIRKALAEIGGRICVVMSKERLTFHDFSQLLIDAGARNAIYLVGSSSYGFYVNEAGDKIFTGPKPKKSAENINYIIWE